MINESLQNMHIVHCYKLTMHRKQLDFLKWNTYILTNLIRPTANLLKKKGTIFYVYQDINKGWSRDQTS